MIQKPRVRSVRLTIEDAQEFDRLCKEMGVKKQYIMESLIKGWIELNKVKEREEAQLGYHWKRKKEVKNGV